MRIPRWPLALTLTASVILTGCTTYRILTNGEPDTQTYKIFPQRAVEPAETPWLLPTSPADFPKSVTFFYQGRQRTQRLDDLLTASKTTAFLVIRNDKILFEAYPNAARDTPHNSFSVSKSFVSTLIGIALAEGKISSLDDPVVRYLPEIKGRGLDELTIRHLLTMGSGLPYKPSDDGMAWYDWLAAPFGDEAQVFYSPDLRQLSLGVRPSGEPVGAFFRYNDYYPLLEAQILERVTGQSLTQYFQEKIWKPMGAEYPAAWTIDSQNDGLERAPSGLVARAVDYARFGLVFLHQGQGNGRQIVSKSWVVEATAPDTADQRPWKTYGLWPRFGGYYKYHWWGLKGFGEKYDFMARGVRGQTLYVSPSKKAVVVRLGEEPDHNLIWPFVIRSLLESLPDEPEVPVLGKP